jgi:hypothetical protein
VPSPYDEARDLDEALRKAGEKSEAPAAEAPAAETPAAEAREGEPGPRKGEP